MLKHLEISLPVDCHRSILTKDIVSQEEQSTQIEGFRFTMRWQAIYKQ